MFIFGFTERSIVVGSTVMRANIALIRALHFPRACLPLAYVLVEFQQLLLSLLVLFTIVLARENRSRGTGCYSRRSWSCRRRSTWAPR